MIEHIDHILIAAPGIQIEGGRILGSVGAGGIAIGLTTVLIAGTREPKAGKGKIRKKLTSDQAQWTGVAAGTLYMVAGSIWTAGDQISDAFTGLITNGGFGTAGPGAAAATLAAVMYFREMTPGKSALTGILAAGVWAQASGIWILPKALILTGAAAIGLL